MSGAYASRSRVQASVSQAANWAGRHHTTIVPHRAVSALVTTGPYRMTRNPMYTGLAIAYLGGALLSGSWVATCHPPVRPPSRPTDRHRPRRALPGQQVRPALHRLPVARPALTLTHCP